MFSRPKRHRIAPLSVYRYHMTMGRKKAHSEPSQAADSTPEKSSKRAEDSQAKTYDTLSLCQKDFIDSFIDKDSPTYGNATQSYLRAHPNASYFTANVEGSRSLRSPRIKTAIEELLEESGAGYKVRLRSVSDIALNRKPSSSRTRTTHPDGSVTVQETESDTPPSARMQAHKVLLKLAGDEDRARATNQLLSDELLKRGREYLRLYNKVDTPRATGHGDGGKEGGGYTIHSPSDISDEKTNGGDA